MIPDNIFIALGAVAAAIIAGIFSYINLVSSKETKVSEFRQAWINGLRGEISEYISSVRMLIEKIHSDNRGKYIAPHIAMDAKNKYESIYNSLFKAKTSILLRINTKENKEKLIKMNNEFLDSVEAIHLNFESGKFTEAIQEMDLLVEKAREILKYEWNRARDGEPGYQKAKKTAFYTVIVAVVILVLTVGIKLIVSLAPTSSAASAASAAIIQKDKPASIQTNITSQSSGPAKAAR